MAGVNYPTDRPDGTTNDTTLAIDNIYDHRESKLQAGKCNLVNTGDVIETLKDDGTTVVAHTLQVGDIVFFPTVVNEALGVIASSPGETTTYYSVYTVPTASTFRIAAFTMSTGTVGSAITITDDTTGTYVSYNGTIDGAERFGVTEVLGDLMGMTYTAIGAAATACSDTIPATALVAGDSVLAQLMSEITQLYDALVPVRVPVTTAAASGVFTVAAGHGITKEGTAIIWTDADSTGLSTSAGVYTVDILTTTTFSLTFVATGLAYTSSATGAPKFYLPLSKAEQAYLTNLKSLKFYRVQDLALTLAFELKRLNAEINNVADTGVLPNSTYPSGDQTWNY
jgi:hypothetical protein